MIIFITISQLAGGGAEHVGTMLANGFVKSGHDVYVITNKFAHVDYIVDEKVKILNLVHSDKNRIVKWYSAVLKLRKYVKIYKPDVVIGISQLCAFISKIATVGTKTHVVMTEHDTFERPNSAPMPKIEYLCKFYVNKIYELVTVITQADKNCIDKRLKNVVVMPNPLSLKPIEHIPTKKKIVLAAGRLDIWYCKGFDVLINAWGQVNKRINVNKLGWKLIIAGRGNKKNIDFLKQLSKENGVENSVELTGFIENMESLYKESSIFVMSSRFEGFGLVLIEAMSQGCACIAANYKGRAKEILLSNENGLLCEIDDVDELSQQIEFLLLNEKQRTLLQNNAIKRSYFYHLDSIIEKWENLLSCICK